MVVLSGDISEGKEGTYRCTITDPEGYVTAVGRFKNGIFTNVLDDPDCIDCVYTETMTVSDELREKYKFYGKVPDYDRFYGNTDKYKRPSWLGLMIKKRGFLNEYPDNYYITFGRWTDGVLDGPTTEYEYRIDGITCLKGVYDRGEKVGTWLGYTITQETDTVQDGLSRNPKTTTRKQLTQYTYPATKEEAEKLALPSMSGESSKYISMVREIDEEYVITRKLFADAHNSHSEYVWLTYNDSKRDYEGEYAICDSEYNIVTKYKWQNKEWAQLYDYSFAQKAIETVVHAKEKAKNFIKMSIDDNIDRFCDKIIQSAYEESSISGTVADIMFPVLADSAKAAADAKVDEIVDAVVDRVYN